MCRVCLLTKHVLSLLLKKRFLLLVRPFSSNWHFWQMTQMSDKCLLYETEKTRDIWTNSDYLSRLRPLNTLQLNIKSPCPSTWTPVEYDVCHRLVFQHLKEHQTNGGDLENLSAKLATIAKEKVLPQYYWIVGSEFSWNALKTFNFRAQLTTLRS